MMLKMMFDGNQTSFNIIQHHATACNMVAKRVQHSGINNVEWCCINMSDPFDWALNETANFTPPNLLISSPPVMLKSINFNLARKYRSRLLSMKFNYTDRYTLTACFFSSFINAQKEKKMPKVYKYCYPKHDRCLKSAIYNRTSY